MLKCQVCGFEHPIMIHNAHLKAHGLTGQEYKRLYPGHALRIQPEETRLKSSNTKKGKPNLKLRGRVRSEEHSKKLSETIKRKFQSGEIVHWNKGRTTSEEVKKKISDSNKKIAEEGRMNPGNITQRAQKQQRMHNAAKIFNCEILHIDEENKITTAKCHECSLEFKFTNQIFYPSRLEKINKLCPTCQPRITFSSNGEKEVFDFISQHAKTPVIPNERSVLGGKEIDIYVPSLKLGFEFTGLYWHAEKQNPEKKHLLWKQQFAHRCGVRLITILEDEWILKKEIVKSRIMGLLNVSTEKIYARDCTIKVVDKKLKSEFLTKCHLQGDDVGTYAIGLFYEDRLVSIATFKKTSFIKGGNGDSWELNRFCSVLNTHVVGGASRLISHFQKNVNVEKRPLISYADRRWSDGHLYKKIGFEFVAETAPSYWYITNRYCKRVHRSALMKHRLVKCEEDKQMTEWELAQREGYDRIWDCGTTKWILEK